MKKIILVLAILVVSNLGFAKGLKDETEARQVARQFSEAIAKGDIEGAKTLIKPYFPLSDSDFSGLFVKIKNSGQESKKLFGNPVGVSFLEVKTKGDAFLKYSFAEKFDRHAVIWDIYFYKPKTEWQVNGIFWAKDTKSWFSN